MPPVRRTTPGLLPGTGAATDASHKRVSQVDVTVRGLSTALRGKDGASSAEPLRTETVPRLISENHARSNADVKETVKYTAPVTRRPAKVLKASDVLNREDASIQKSAKGWELLGFDLHTDWKTEQERRATIDTGSVPKTILRQKPISQIGVSAKSKAVADALRSAKTGKVRKMMFPDLEEVTNKSNTAHSRRNGAEYGAWLDSQVHSLTAWLNFDLGGPHVGDPIHAGTSGEEGVRSIVPDVKLRTEHRNRVGLAALHALNESVQHQRDLKNARQLYASESFSKVAGSLTKAIADDKIIVRSSINFRKDFGVRDDIVRILLCYSLPWLSLALEVVTGKLLAPSDRNERGRIAQFIMQNVLSGRDNGCESVRFANSRDAHQRRTLCSLLLLVSLLDTAKIARVLPGDPCLFRKSAKLKSTREVMLHICSTCLSGEGDFIRHLGLLGCNVRVLQSPLDEMDFSVTNLSCDLRDGVRLCRLVELQTKRSDLLPKLLYPAMTRESTAHNVNLLFRALREDGVILDSGECGTITTSDIIDGHRERTLALLWHLVTHWKLPSIVSVCLLQSEIDQLKMDYLGRFSKAWPLDAEEQASSGSQWLSVLLNWSRAVCAFYGMRLYSFAESFTDGRAFCYLLAYYHPALLNETAISAPGTRGMEPHTEVYEPTSARIANFRALRQSTARLGGVPMIMKIDDTVIPDERAVVAYVAFLASRLLHLRDEIRAAKVIQRLWIRRSCMRKIRRMIDAEKARKEKQLVSAATLVQATWRCRRQRVQFVELRKTAVTIQKFWRINRARRHAALLRDAARRRELGRREAAALRIQAAYRGYRCRLEWAQMRRAVRTVEVRRRMLLETRQIETWYNRVRNATLQLQRKRRGVLELRRAREVRLRREEAAKVIQAAWMMFVSRRHFCDVKRAVLFVQRARRRNVLGRQTRHDYIALRDATITVKRLRRKLLDARSQQRIAEERRRAALTIQAGWRAAMVGRAVRHDFVALRNAAVTLQCLHRGRMARKTYAATRAAIVRIQTVFRCWFQHRAYRRTRAAALTIQKYARRLIAQTRLDKLRQEERRRIDEERERRLQHVLRWAAKARIVLGAVIIQRSYRRHRARKIARARVERRANYAARYLSAIKIQRAYRRHVKVEKAKARARYLCRFSARARLVLATSAIQRAYRRYLAWRKAEQRLVYVEEWAKSARKILSAVAVQRSYRKHLVLRKAEERSRYVESWARAARCFLSVTIIQHAYRRYQLRKVAELRLRRLDRWVSTARLVLACVLIQRKYRRHLLIEKAKARARYVGRWAAVVRIALSAIVTQRAYRRHRARRLAAARFSAVATIQRYWAARNERRLFIALRGAACTIQVAYRRRGRRRRLWGWEELVEKLKERRQTAAVMVQALWRGHQVRMRSPKDIAMVRMRVHEANAVAQELSSRTALAMGILEKPCMLGSLRKACCHLDIVTARSSMCCRSAVERNVAKYLWDVVRDCNGSKPYMEILVIAMRVLGNLAVHASTRIHVLDPPDSAERLVEVIQRYKDNEQVIVYAMKMACLLAKDEKSLHKLRAVPCGPQRLRNVLSLLTRRTLLASKQTPGPRRTNHDRPPTSKVDVLQMLECLVGKVGR